jgi:oligopeptidase A
MTIFLEKFNTKHNSAPFSKINLSEYKTAFETCIAKAKAEIDAVITNTEKPTFENTIEALDFAGENLDRLSSIFFNLNSAETSEEMQKIAQEVSPLLTAFSNYR